MKTQKEIQEYYNDYSKKQFKTGINLRHYYLINKLIEVGLKKNHKVLEIGCGIGTLTGLIQKVVKSGKIIAADISDESINIAKQRLKNKGNIDFFVTDMTNFSIPEVFDFVILPDVLEHIPVENHKKLFATINNHMNNNSVIFINIPHPLSIEYMGKHQPEKLQVIDQAIHLNILAESVYSNNLQIIDYKPYKLYHNYVDYVLITIKRKNELKYESLSQSNIILKKLKERVSFYFSLVLRMCKIQ